MPCKAKLFSQGCCFGSHFVAQVFMTLPPPRRRLCLRRGLTRHQKRQKHNTRGVIGNDTQTTLVVHLSVLKNQKNKKQKEETGATSHMICSDTRQRWKKHELTRRAACSVKTQDGNFCSFCRRAVKHQQPVSAPLCQSVSSVSRTTGPQP